MLSKSLVFRFFFSECLVLVVFFALVVVAFGFDFGIKQAAIDRLQFQQDTLKSIAEVTQMKIPSTIFQPGFDTPNSGLYGFIHSEDVGSTRIWSSISAGNMKIPTPPNAPECLLLVGGNCIFGTDKLDLYSVLINSLQISPACLFWSDNTNLGFERYVLQCHVKSLVEKSSHRDYVITVMEKKWFVMDQLDKLQETLKYWLLGLALMLVTVKFVVLRFGLKPLHNMVNDLKAIDEGKKTLLEGDYPLELQGLAQTLNTLITRERVHTERQRNRLAHLAHGIKTPLTILRGYAELLELDNKKAIDDEISRIDAIIEFQLQKATAKVEDNVSRSVNVVEVIELQCDNFKKAYSNKGIHFDLPISEQCFYYCEKTELNEILGNLIDNACKWCNQSVKISINQNERKDRRNYSIVLHIEDDGPGIPVGKYNEILKWGGRADDSVKGHGIGVSVVNELVGMLGGVLQGGTSPSLGGMRWRIYLP